MANTFNTGVHKEDWAVALQKRLNKPANWEEVADVVYSDNYIVNNPYMSTEFSAQTGTRGTAYGFSDFALTNDALTISTKRLVPVFIDRADLAQISYLTQMEISTRQAALLKDVIETAMLADHAAWTNVGDTAGVITSGVATTITVSSTNIDDIVRGVRRIAIVANGLDLMNEKGLFFIWRPADLEKLEQFAQANGFNLADMALEKGIPAKGFYYLGAYHYVSNSHTANHVFAGIRKIFKIGILRTTWGQIVVTQDPPDGNGPRSGEGIIARADYGVLSPAGLTTVLYDVNVAS